MPQYASLPNEDFPECLSLLTVFKRGADRHNANMIFSRRKIPSLALFVSRRQHSVKLRETPYVAFVLTNPDVNCILQIEIDSRSGRVSETGNRRI